MWVQSAVIFFVCFRPYYSKSVQKSRIFHFQTLEDMRVGYWTIIINVFALQYNSTFLSKRFLRMITVVIRHKRPKYLYFLLFQVFLYDCKTCLLLWYWYIHHSSRQKNPLKYMKCRMSCNSFYNDGDYVVRSTRYYSKRWIERTP